MLINVHMCNIAMQYVSQDIFTLFQFSIECRISQQWQASQSQRSEANRRDWKEERGRSKSAKQARRRVTED
jgi:hypothetical protein